MDTLTPAERSERMSRIRSKDTKPELVVRRVVHGLGYRYRLHGQALPGRPDLVFRARRKAIFVHGCFWHRHLGCPNARIPKSRRDFWTEKLEANARRDRENIEKLNERGWDALIIWECETRDREALVGRVATFLGPRKVYRTAFWSENHLRQRRSSQLFRSYSTILKHTTTSAIHISPTCALREALMCGTF